MTIVVRFFLLQIDRGRSVMRGAQRTDCIESGATCDRPSEEAEPTSMCKKLGTIRGNQQSSINRVARETKTAGTLAVVVGGFVACWLPFFILYLATPFVPVQPPDVLMPALTWLGILPFFTRHMFRLVKTGSSLTAEFRYRRIFGENRFRARWKKKKSAPPLSRRFPSFSLVQAELRSRCKIPPRQNDLNLRLVALFWLRTAEDFRESTYFYPSTSLFNFLALPIHTCVRSEAKKLLIILVI